MTANIGFIIKDSTPAVLDIQQGLFVETFGVSSERSFNVAEGAGVENLRAGSTVNLEGDSSAFSFVRNGTTLEIRDSDNNVAAQVAASPNAESKIRFGDGSATVAVGQAGNNITFAEQSFSPGDSVNGGANGVTLDTSDTSQSFFDGSGDDSGNEAPDTGGGNTLTGEVLVDGNQVDAIPTNGSAFTIGNNGSGSAALTDGEGRTFTSDNLDNVNIGAQSGSDGTLTLQGAGTDIVTAGTGNTVQVGRVGKGSLVVDNGAEVSTLQFEVGRRGDGDATISGQGSKVTASNDNGLFSGQFAFESGFARIGRKPGSEGRVEVLNGGELEIRPGETQNSDTSGPGLSLGEELGSNGDLIVDGSGSIVDIRQNSPFNQLQPFLEIGEGLGQGDVTIRNGGEISLDGPRSFVGVSDAQVGGDGADNTSDTSAVEQSTVTIESGGTLTISDETDGGTVTLMVGQRTGADGKVEVTGSNSEISLDADQFTQISLGGFQNTQTGGTGELTVSDGGKITDLTWLNLGHVGDGSGTMLLDGDGTKVTMNGIFNSGEATFAQIGRNGTGDMTVRNGAEWTIEGGTGDYPGFAVGREAGSNGTLTVDGDGSKIEITGTSTAAGGGGGFIAIGYSGTGETTVSNGGQILNSDDNSLTYVGRKSTGDGTLTVKDQGSVFDAGVQMLIGADINFDTGDILTNSNRSGSVTVESGGTLRAGAAENDGVDDIIIGSGGSLTVTNGATLVGDVRNDGGTFTPGNSPGLAKIDGDFDHDGELTFEFNGTARSDYDRIDVAGTAELSGEVTFAFNPSFDVDAGDSFDILKADDDLDLSGLTTDVTGLSDLLDVRLVQDGNALTLVVDDAGIA